MRRTRFGPPAPSGSSVRAQLLATEHWSVLATRGMTQSEMLLRIQMFLTLTSATVVSLALVGQVTAFSGIFPTFAITLLSVVLVVGSLTVVRVYSAGNEDFAYVIAMNRLRAAYEELDPGISRYFVSSRHDDVRGADRTYSPLDRPSPLHFFGSSMMFITAINAAIAAVLSASVAHTAGAGGWIWVIGAGFAAVYIATAMALGLRRFSRVRRGLRSISPTPES